MKRTAAGMSRRDSRKVGRGRRARWRGVSRASLASAMLARGAWAGAAADTTNAPVPRTELAPVPEPVQLEMAMRALRVRQERISAKAISYLWDQRMDRTTGRIGKVQARYVHALCWLALVSDGSADAPLYRERVEKVIASLRQPIEELADKAGAESKIFVGTSRETLAFETHAVVALAYEQLAAADLGNPAQSELFARGAESAIAYIMDFRKRGRNYDTAGGWPVNAAPYNLNRPDRRCTVWQLLLMKAHTYAGGKVDSTAMEEGPNFIFAAQRVAPEMTDSLREAEKTYKEWIPRIRRGEPVTEQVRDRLNDFYEYRRQLEDAGGFGLDTIGIITPGATAVGLYTMGLFRFEDAARYRAAVQAYVRMPLAWDAQRSFMTQFFATRGLLMYSERFQTLDFCTYMNRLLTLMEQKQDADGSFPLGSYGVEELNEMERVYTTAMCVLIVNCNRGNLLFDRPAF